MGKQTSQARVRGVTRSRQEYGGAMIVAFVLLTIMSLSYALLNRMATEEIKIFTLTQKATLSTTIVGSAKAQTKAIIGGGASSLCGQTLSGCPGVYPDPITCDTDDISFRTFTTGPSWEFSPSGTSSFMVGDQSEALSRMERDGLKELDLDSRRSISAGGGTLDFRMAAIGRASHERFVNRFGDHNIPEDRYTSVTSEIVGLECKTREAVDAVYVKTAHLYKGEEVSKSTYRLPIHYPSPYCLVTAGTNYITTEDETIDVSMIVNGPWKRAYNPDGTRINNDIKMTIDAADLTFNGTIDLPERGKCDLYLYISGSARGVHNSTGSCSTYLYYSDLTVMDLADDCPAKISYIRRHEAEHGAGSTPPTPAPYVPRQNDDVDLVPVVCPDPYFVRHNGEMRLKTYIVTDKMECMAVFARDMIGAGP